VEDDFWRKTTFGGRHPLVKDDLWWRLKTTFGGRRPSVKDDLWWNMTFGGRQPSVEDDLRGILACRFAAFLHVQTKIQESDQVIIVAPPSPQCMIE